ncbi:MAG: ATP-binding protein [Eubacteriales bacterium]
MKMRFWQKTYILTLILFLISLNAGIFSLAWHTYSRSVAAAKDACISKQYYISKCFGRDIEDMNAAGSVSSPVLLMQSYGEHYGKQQTLLYFYNSAGGLEYSSAVYDIKCSESGTVVRQDIDGKRYFVVTSVIENTDYTLVCATDYSSLDEEFRALMITYTLTSAGISALLAVALFFVLKRLSVPLDRLRSTTELIASGDTSVRADESGNDEFSVLARSFNKMVGRINIQIEELSAEAENKQRLVDNMAHELRTPLTCIHGYAEYIEKAAVSDEEKIDAAIQIASESERLLAISNKLLDTAYVRGTVPDLSPVSLPDILIGVADGLAIRARDREVRLTCNVSDATVNGDATLLGMLFYNLADNAVKACDRGGTVELYCAGKVARVTDTGRGISKDQLVHITEPFYRTDKSRSREEGGAGLGLALCSSIADAHSAVLSFASAPGEGTAVTVEFTS